MSGVMVTLEPQCLLARKVELDELGDIPEQYRGKAVIIPCERPEHPEGTPHAMWDDTQLRYLPFKANTRLERQGALAYRAAVPVAS